MDGTRNGLDRLYNGKKNLEYLIQKSTDRELNDEDKMEIEKIEAFKLEFIRGMEDDLNTADAIAAIFELVRYTNGNMDENTPKVIIEKAYDYLIELSNVLGILNKKDEILEEEIIKLIEKRTQARKDKDFKMSDDIRDILLEKRIILEDTQEGVKWKRI